jgi:hypothetical protein
MHGQLSRIFSHSSSWHLVLAGLRFKFGPASGPGFVRVVPKQSAPSSANGGIGFSRRDELQARLDRLALGLEVARSHDVVHELVVDVDVGSHA